MANALADRVLAYGDCAVVPDPSSEQLADIAISSAGTAARFGIEPRVAMLSYSTGASGTGADVDKVRAATELVRERDPELPVEGPIQYDAAIEPAVASAKLPNSAVAGKATVSGARVRCRRAGPRPDPPCSSFPWNSLDAIDLECTPSKGDSAPGTRSQL